MIWLSSKRTYVLSTPILISARICTPSLLSAARGSRTVQVSSVGKSRLVGTTNAVALLYGANAVVLSILHAGPGVENLLPLGLLRSKPLARIGDARYVPEVEYLHI